MSNFVRDFVSDFWSYYIAILTLASIIGCAVLLKIMTTRKLAPGEKVDTHGHVWDEDLTEWNNPLPNWWRWLFYLTIVFALLYLVFYPGLGTFQGNFGWSSRGQYDDEVKTAEQNYGPIYNKFMQQELKTVAADPEAREMGQRLFLTYCSQCHGSDAQGSGNFPNLSDEDWLYGGEPEIIKLSIANGRNGVMPPHAQVLGEQGVKEMVHYVLSLSGRSHDAKAAAAAKERFMTICAACHGPDGKGNPAIGAPNLTDKGWLYGGSETSVAETISKGRAGVMPAWKDFLGEAKVHLLAAYVYGLSQPESKGKP